MKWSWAVFGNWFLIPGIVLAQEPVDPFAPAEKDGAISIPPRLTCHFEVIDVERKFWIDWVTEPANSVEGPELYRNARNLIEKGEATVMDTLISAGLPGQRARVESVEEKIFTSEYDPPDRPGASAVEFGPELFDPEYELVFYGDYETRETGSFAEMAFGFADDGMPGGRAYQTEHSYSKVDKIGEMPKGDGIGAWQLPIFASRGSTQTNRLSLGRPVLIGNWSPPETNQRNSDRIRLVFARLDQHTFEKKEITKRIARDNEEIDPFRKIEKQEDWWKHLSARVGLVVEWIEVEHDDLCQAVNRPLNGHEIRQEVAEWIRQGRARVLKAATGQSLANVSNRFEEIKEVIYTNDYDPA